MPLDFRKFKREIEDRGCSLQETTKGHYRVVAPGGRILTVFAVTHGKHTKGGEVYNHYVNQVRRLIDEFDNQMET